LVENDERKRSLGRPGHRLEDNINKMDFRGIGMEGVECIYLAQVRD
jgi:hypothetical protein